jgi:hypothetical protein
MSWESYEVWAQDDDGREFLLETTRSKKEAIQIAQKNIDESVAILVYREFGDDYDLVSRLTKDDTGSIIVNNV